MPGAQQGSLPILTPKQMTSSAWTMVDCLHNKLLFSPVVLTEEKWIPSTEQTKTPRC